MRFQIVLLLLIAAFLQSCTAAPAPGKIDTERVNKKYDLVLIHGLANMHKWSDSFLETCLEIWGSGHVFVVYSGPESSVFEKNMNGGVLIAGGGDGDNAGTASIDEQVTNITQVIQILQDGHGLRAPFSIIAHSMGGLVARQYIYKKPNMVAGLVTLGTPHKGSPLADSFQWIGHFLDATNAIEDLKPTNVSRFNEKYPVKNTPLSHNKQIQTIRGVPDATDCFGWAGELLLGYQILSTVYNTRNDGLVPYDSSVINETEHIADFPHYDHYDLVRQPDVIKKAAEYLP